MRPRRAAQLAVVLAAALGVPARARWRRAPAPPDAMAALARAAAPEVSSYAGRLRVEVYGQGVSEPRELRVRFQAPDRYRREILDGDGRVVILIVSDGATEWIYDKSKGKVWEGEASGTGQRQFGSQDALELIRANYDAKVANGPKVARRKTWIVSLRSKADHKLKRRLWLDRKTGLILRSEEFLPDGSLSSSMAFSKIAFNRRQKEAAFRFKPPRGAVVVRRLEPDPVSLGQAKAASGMDPRLPAWLPPGYVFESLDVLPRGGRNIIHYRFSDGINVVSLFQCPPHVRLDLGPKAGQTVQLGSGPGVLEWTNEGEVLGWSSGADKFVLIGPIGSSDLERIADSIR